MTLFTTDDERLAEIELWLGHHDDRVDFLLRIIRDQRAELTQARQAITFLRNWRDRDV